MKTQLWAMDSHLLPLLVWLGFHMSSTLIQPSLDSPRFFISLQSSSLVASHTPLCICPRLPKTHLCPGSSGAGAHVLRCSLHPQLKETEVRCPAVQVSSRTKAIPLNESGNRPHPCHLIFTAFPTLRHFTGPITTSSFSVL